LLAHHGISNDEEPVALPFIVEYVKRKKLATLGFSAPLKDLNPIGEAILLYIHDQFLKAEQDEIEARKNKG
jgi:hypothetical protein